MATISSRSHARDVPSRATDRSARTPGRVVQLTAFYVLLVLIAFVFVGPYLLSASASFKSLAQINATHAWSLPTSPGLDNFRTIFSQYDFREYLLNTLVVTVILTVGQVVFSLMGAYAFARL